MSSPATVNSPLASVEPLDTVSSTQFQSLPRLCRSENASAHGFDDRARLFDQLRIARIYTAAQVQIVLETHTHSAAEKDGLRHPRHLHAADGERCPDGVRRQRIYHGGKVTSVRGHPVRDSHAELDQGGGRDEVLLDHLPDEPEIARVE